MITYYAQMMNTGLTQTQTSTTILSVGSRIISLLVILGIPLYAIWPSLTAMCLEVDSTAANNNIL